MQVGEFFCSLPRFIWYHSYSCRKSWWECIRNSQWFCFTALLRSVRLISIYGPLTSASHGFAFARIQIANYLCKGNYTASFSKKPARFFRFFFPSFVGVQRVQKLWEFQSVFLASRCPPSWLMENGKTPRSLVTRKPAPNWQKLPSRSLRFPKDGRPFWQLATVFSGEMMCKLKAI